MPFSARLQQYLQRVTALTVLAMADAQLRTVARRSVEHMDTGRLISQISAFCVVLRSPSVFGLHSSVTLVSSVPLIVWI